MTTIPASNAGGIELGVGGMAVSTGGVSRPQTAGDRPRRLVTASDQRGVPSPAFTYRRRTPEDPVLCRVVDGELPAVRSLLREAGDGQGGGKGLLPPHVILSEAQRSRRILREALSLRLVAPGRPIRVSQP
jgi:hypothetical protein